MKIDKHCFSNGLRLVYRKDIDTQMVVLNIVYDVDACDEYPEHISFAHPFEHLVFGDSAYILDYDTPSQLAGGESNAWTNNDIINYYLTVPKTSVGTAFWLESDRVLELAFSEQGPEVQRSTVMEEFKQCRLNQPYGDIGHLFRSLALQAHPYRWPTIGKELPHIEQAVLDEAKSFLYHFHVPDNAMLVVTGNISWEETIRPTERWFGFVPRRNVPVRRLSREPGQTEERGLTVERNVPLDALLMGYHMCDRGSIDYYIFDILSDILSNGCFSRLNRRLVQGQNTFSGIDTYISGTRNTGLLRISGKSAADTSLEQVEAAVRRELEELRQSSVGAQELREVKNEFESTQILGNINYLNVAINLTWSELTGKVGDIGPEVKHYRSITTEQLHTVAQRAFCKNSTIVLYYKGDR